MKKALFITVWALWLFSQSSLASELTPFKAEYDVYRNTSKVGVAHFNLQHENGLWNWDIKTEVQGFYRYLTSKRPFTHTLMQVVNNQPQLLLEENGDYPDKPAQHTAWFDYRSKTVYSMKDQSVNTTQLPEKIYNYHSIHLLYPDMLQQDAPEIKVNFYRKGSISPSTITLEKGVKLRHKSHKLTVDRMTQRFEDSDKTMIYDYQNGSSVPVRIEQIKPGKDSTMMWRTSST